MANHLSIPHIDLFSGLIHDLMLPFNRDLVDVKLWLQKQLLCVDPAIYATSIDELLAIATVTASHPLKLILTL